MLRKHTTNAEKDTNPTSRMCVLTEQAGYNHCQVEPQSSIIRTHHKMCLSLADKDRTEEARHQHRPANQKPVFRSRQLQAAAWEPQKARIV